MPEEVAVKITKWRGEDWKHKNSESLLVERGFKFDHVNVVKVFLISIDKINADCTKQTIYMDGDV